MIDMIILYLTYYIIIITYYILYLARLYRYNRVSVLESITFKVNGLKLNALSLIKAL